MERMNGIDPMFVYSDTRHTPMEIAYACVFDPSTADGGYSFERVQGVLESRMPNLTPFRRRLMPVPLGLDNPRWVDDPDFDLSNHLHRDAAPAPGGADEFCDMVAEVMGRPLLPEQPPWEMHVVEGLAGGMIGLIAKVHHSVIDGVAGAALLAQLLDLTPEGSAVINPCPPWMPAGLPTQRELVADALPSFLRGPTRGLRAAREIGRTAVRMARCAVDATTGPIAIPLGAPRVFETPITARREVRFAVLDLNEVRQLKDRFGSTINDVVLAVCSGALRSHLAANGRDPDTPLVAVVPVSVRPDQTDATGNQLSAMFVTLANDCKTPLERLRAVTEASASSKGQEHAVGYGPMAVRLAEAIPPAVAKPMIQLGVRSGIVRKARPGNLMISNVPGPDFPLYFAGMELRAVYPLGPVMDGVSPLNITVQSYLNSLFVGINASAKASPDLAGLAQAMEDELLLLSKMANGAGPPRSAAVRHRRTPQAGGHRRAQSTSPQTPEPADTPD
ncbi:MAG TPA: wax ester/triacylglycerol synthase family O-acyltransferase [Acidimicrobiales bacterium]|nr:wax ester/triacylglycerol synthase family O-acyltransferase [Acidimicrobiales bacterium]